MEAIFSVCSVQYKQGGWKSIEECAVKLVKDVYKMLFTDGGLYEFCDGTTRRVLDWDDVSSPSFLIAASGQSKSDNLPR